MRAFDPNLRPQFTQQWNVFVERLLTSSMSLNVGYVGHHATKLVAPVEGNQPLPGVGDPSTWASLNSRRPLIQEQPLITTIATTAAAGRSNYNALQASIRQRSWNGLEFLASYTFSKILTNNLGYYGSGGVAAEGAYWMNAYEPEWNYGRAFADARHNFVLAANYELPFGKGMKWGSEWGGLTDAILGGWKLSAIYQVRTGFPITVTDIGGRTLQAVRGNERPNCIGNPVPANQGMTSDPNAPNDCEVDRHQRLPVGAARHVGRLRHRHHRRARLHQHRPHARQALQHGRRAVPRVPGRGVQRVQPPELGAAGPQPREPQHVRHHHRDGQRPAGDPVRLEVLLLGSAARPAVGSRFGR